MFFADDYINFTFEKRIYNENSNGKRKAVFRPAIYKSTRTVAFISDTGALERAHKIFYKLFANEYNHPMTHRLTAILIALLVVFTVAEVTTAAPVDGHVYRIVNAGYNEAMIAAGAGNITAAAINEDEPAQLWLAEANPAGTGFYMRNLKTGYYMSSSRARSRVWQAQFSIEPDDPSMLLTFVPTGKNYFIHTVAGYGKTDDEGTHGFAHEDGSHRVVGWNTSSENTKWNLVEPDGITSAQIADAKKQWQTSVSKIEAGKVYRIRNYNYGHALAPSGDMLVGAQVSEADTAQMWLVENNPSGEGYLIRNYASGKLVASSRESGKQWSLQDTYVPNQTVSALRFNKRSTGFAFSTLSTYQPDNEANDYTYAHEDAQRAVVGWLVTTNPSVWHFSVVDDITPADIAAKTQTWPCFKQNTVANALAAIFTDAACTELTPEYASIDPASLDTDPNVLALPEPLRPMVRKILLDDWSETDPYNGNEWDSSHARKFRVMMAEPYSDAGHGATLAGIQAYGDVNNPTGIVTDNGTTLYIMVDKEPREGSTLRIAGRTGEGTPMVTLNNNSDGVLLKKGLNVVECNQDLADMIIYYTVRTTNNRTRLRELTDYEDIKIHIEGGSLNGYFNAQGDALYEPDTNEDWLYYRERARHAMFMLLSKYNSLYIHFHDIFDDNGNRTQCLKSLCSPEAYAQGLFDLNATMRAWDEMFVAETLIMGLQPDSLIESEKAAGRDYYDTLAGDDLARDDYYKYFNNRHLGISLRECAFMNATWWRTAYNPGTISSIIREFPTGDFWGPAHEFGHLNQGPMNIAGSTEESNNVFSNVALFYRGEHTSRADYPSVQRQRFNEGQNFHEHSTWGTTRMWFQLWLYYHAIGHNKRFYPRLYELLRNNPLRRTTAPGHEGEENPMLAKDDLLHFAKMACVAAGEDLTDFFDAWGFLEVQDGYYIGDYTSYTSYLSAEDIAEWRQEIATLAAENGWKKNQAIIFIDDRVGSDKKSYEFDKNKCGTMGGLNDFRQGAPVNGEYTFTITGTTVKVTGATGGVGFLIHDEAGELIGFANETTFEVGPEAAEKIRSGQCTFQVLCPDNSAVTVVDAIHSGSLEQRLQAMDELLAKSAEVLALSDRYGCNPGFLRPEFTAELQSVYDDVKTQREEGRITTENSGELYDALYGQFMAVRGITATLENTIPVTPGAIYVFISNKLYPGKGIKANDAGTQLANVNVGEVDADDEAQQWIFEPTDEEDYYYIRNVKFNKYIGKASADKGAIPLLDQPMKQLVLFRELALFTISPEGSDHDSLHDDGYGRLTRWDSSASASRWTLNMLDNWEYKGALADLLAVIANSETLMAKVGTITDTPQGTVAEPLAEYTFVTPEMLIDLYTLVAAGKELVASAGPDSVDELKASYAAISAAYQTLLAAVNRNVGRLEELIERTRELAVAIANARETIEPISFAEENMFSNAYYTGNNNDKFTSWSVLSDNNYSTYFHSNYDNVNTSDGLDHYIRMQLPVVSDDDRTIIFSYATRKGNQSNFYPVEATLEYSATGEDWNTAAELSDELPIISAFLFESEPLTIPAGTEYIRFMVHKNRFSATDASSKQAGGHCFFVVSEMGISDYTVSCEPDLETYPKADTDVIRKAVTQLHAAAQTLARPDFGNARFDAAYEALLPHYEALLEIYNDRLTDIDTIFIGDANSLNRAVIYTLGGIRVGSIATPGIYIINGKKTFVR